ncbi:cyclic nucleotide-gated cation channel beta-1-like [Centruroides sculpturatus]|uniref:cyclic nucleotide-gated cation channel beta-1-like n=1 Tax=Centruroides sculpturatus TaxID=218467 RepID=UPI000C6E0136|nr:cyclic nucleotide-gated cation channel beta-1-like [Centruroides sculpturatus]
MISENNNQNRNRHISTSEQNLRIETNLSTYINQKIRVLTDAFSSRAQRFREIIIQPPTPSSSPQPEELEEPQDRPRLQSLIQHEDDPPADDSWLDEMVDVWCCQLKRRYIPTFPKVLDPQSKLYITWLLIVTICYLYNAWIIFFMANFPYLTKENLPMFLGFDYFSDLMYFVDIVLFKVRVRYLYDGFWVDDPVMTRKNYFKKSMFKMDLLSLLPLDLLYLKYGINPLFRIPRILKLQTFWEFFNRVDSVTKSPYVIRIIRTLIYMMYLIHFNACAYYAMSSWEGINSNSWVYNGTGNAYIRCFYFATKTATSIGIGKKFRPSNEFEYVFMIVSWLMGVFIFAFLVGQIRDIFATATRSKTEYRQMMNLTVQYMRNLNVPDDLQTRVRLWLRHTWEQQNTLNEDTILDFFPSKMKMDLAINVHYNTLSKVQLFKDCDKALLRDLVLKLKPVLFLPLDYICMKGEVGKEMYILNKGLVQVMGGENGDVILATLSEGSVFGEISLLGIPGYNRRTANVQSKGFSYLFVLSKSDLWDTLKNYPEAQEILNRKARTLIRQNEALKKMETYKKLHAEIIIREPIIKPTTPKLVKTVIQALSPDCKFSQIIRMKSLIKSDTILQDQPKLLEQKSEINDENKKPEENEEEAIKDIQQVKKIEAAEDKETAKNVESTTPIKDSSQIINDILQLVTSKQSENVVKEEFSSSSLSSSIVSLRRLFRVSSSSSDISQSDSDIPPTASFQSSNSTSSLNDSQKSNLFFENLNF